MPSGRKVGIFAIEVDIRSQAVNRNDLITIWVFVYWKLFPWIQNQFKKEISTLLSLSLRSFSVALFLILATLWLKV